MLVAFSEYLKKAIHAAEDLLRPRARGYRVIGVSLCGFHERLGGLGNYAISLLKAWPAVYPLRILRIFCTKQNFQSAQKLLPWPARVGHRFLHDGDDMRRASKECDIVFYPCAALDCVPPPEGTVFCVADLQERFFPEYFSEEEHARRRNRYRNLLAYADGIFAISDFTKRSLVELLGFPPDDIQVVPCLSADLPRLGVRPEGIPFKNFAFFPADDYPHKNHARLVEALAFLSSKGITVPLICTGSRVSNGAWLETAAGKKLPVWHAGRLSRENVRWLYEHATLLVFPTLFEGFGIPLLEAFRLGVPVVCSNITSLPEVAGGAAEYCDPFDTKSIAAAIERVWSDPVKRDNLREAGYARARLFKSRNLIRRHEKAFKSVKRKAAKSPTVRRLPDINEEQSWRLVGASKPQISSILRKQLDADKENTADLPIHFLTIALNGMPFLKLQWEILQTLDFDWCWHVVEGVAAHTNDTAWSIPNGGRIPPDFHCDGLSIDGTKEFLDHIAQLNPEKVRLYRRKGFWDGKVEMCNRPLTAIGKEVLLWQLDCDEFWDAETIREVRYSFQSDKELMSAQFYCQFYVSPTHVLDNRGFYGNDPAQEWRRVWRFFPGDTWTAHEPPSLARNGTDLLAMKSLKVSDTWTRGWSFDHLAYVTAQQLRFKEQYYGYPAAEYGWRHLCAVPEEHDVRVGEFLRWVPGDLWATSRPSKWVSKVNEIG